MMQQRVDYYQKDVGMVVGIIKGSETNVYSYGKLDKNKTDLVDGNTIFEIGSISKTFICTIFADMVLKGEIGLDDPASKYLPSYVKVPTYNGKEITLRHLATHASALPRDSDNPTDPGNTLEQFLGFISNCKLTREPGSKFEYSNLGMNLLGYILTIKTGTELETLLKKRILEPK
jgi:CubicO group peptidase (beta-lactamase class C family)